MNDIYAHRGREPGAWTQQRGTHPSKKPSSLWWILEIHTLRLCLRQSKALKACLTALLPGPGLCLQPPVLEGKIPQSKVVLNRLSKAAFPPSLRSFCHILIQGQGRE